MATDNDSQSLTHEDRLKAIAYNFVKLYDRWSEDRLLAAKQGADTAELVKQFTEQVKRFETLEPSVRHHIHTTIQQSTSNVAKTVTDETMKAAIRATAEIADELKSIVHRAEDTLKRYQTEVITTQWKIIGVTIITTVLTCLLIVKLLMPVPALPLSNQQIHNLSFGELMNATWPKLSKQEQQHISGLTTEALSELEHDPKLMREMTS
jgi:hypothetical protein